jgi:hypothetical protein
LHHRIDRRDRTTCCEQRGIKRLHGDRGVGVETMEPVCECFFDTTEMLFCVRRLHDSLWCLVRSDLDEGLAEFFIALDRVNDDTVTLRHFRMTVSGIMLFVNRVMYQRGGHKARLP